MKISQKIISLNIVFSMIFMLLPTNVFAVENTATINYKGDGGLPISNTSNTVISTIKTIVSNLDVELNPLITSVEGLPKSTWVFPVNVTNTGIQDDSYTISVDGLPAGVTYKIYRDVNRDGKLDDSDIENDVTNLISQNNISPILLVITDTIGLPVGTVLKPSITATSKTDKNVMNSAAVQLKVGAFSSTGLPIPTPTPSASLAPAVDYQAELKKTVFPTGAAKAGDILTYYIEFTNRNNFYIKDVNVVDNLPSALIPLTDKSLGPVTSDNGKVSYSSNGSNWNDTMDSGIKFMRFSWSSLSPNQKVTAYFKAKISDNVENGNLENMAFANYKMDDVNNPNVVVKDVVQQSLNSNVAVNTIKNEYSIDGTIYDKKTGLPKEGATVIILDKDGKKVGEDITGKSGKYHIPVDGKGEYQVIYRDNQGNQIGQSTANVIKPGITPPPIEIMGKVINSQTKEAVANAKIQLIGPDKKVLIELNTDAEGKYIFNKDSQGQAIKAGTYTIRVINAQGEVSYAKVNVTVADGDVILNLDILIDPFGIVYDALGGKDVRIKGAQVKLISNCDDPNSVVKLDDLDDGTKQSNPVITDDKGKYQYFLNKDQLTNRNYCLLVHADGYKDRQFLVRTAPSKELANKYVLEVTDENGKKTLIQNIESVPYEVPMTPLKTFDITKSANKNSIEIGDVVTYTIEATNKLKFRVKDSHIIDELPFGFKYVPDTLRVNGKALKDFTGIDELLVPVGDVDPNQKVTIMYQTRTGIRVNEGASINYAEIEGKSPQNQFNAKATKNPLDRKNTFNDDIFSEVVKATVFVRKGVFSKNGGVIGKVYIDTNSNGIQDQNEPGVENIALYTSGGIRILTDAKGKYSIPDIQSGDFMIRIDLSSLPANLALPKESTWIGQDDISQRIFIPESGLGKANFRLVKIDKTPDVIVEKPKERPLKAVFVYPDKFAIKQIPYITYPDIANNWARGIIEYESGLEIIHGYPDGEFKPSRSISRAETTKLTLVALKSFDIKMGTTLGYILNKDANVSVKLTDAKDNDIKTFYTNTDKKAGINQLYWDGRDKNNNIVANGNYKLIVEAVSKDKLSSKLATNVEVIPAIENYHASGKANFKDVPDKHWANSFIKVGSDEKLVSGYPDNTFRPDNFIPRYEMAVVAVHALNLDMSSAIDELPFADANEVPQWARKYVYLAYTKGMLNKFPDNKFYPLRNISRAEIAAFVNALINKQKIDASVSGTVDNELNSLEVEGKKLDLTKNKSFTIPLNKEFSEELMIVLPEIKLDVIKDEDYQKKDLRK